jgi:repressor LexA
MASDLTPRQQSVLDYIVEFERKHYMAPTVREICAHLGLRSPAGIHRILNVLKDEGYLLAAPGKKRTYRRGTAVPGRGIPVMGRIAAGNPLEAIENMEEELSMLPEVFGCQRCFALRVQGDSMIEDHIVDGDLAMIRPQKRVENGEIAAVLVEGSLTEATLKRVRFNSSTLVLEPANAAYDTMVFKGPQRKRVTIVGRFVGILRR